MDRLKKQFEQIKTKRKMIGWIAAAVLILAAGLFFLFPKTEEKEDVLIREYPCQKGMVSAFLQGSGNLELAADTLQAPADLKVESISVEKGQNVKKGDLLMTYSKEQAESQIQEKQSVLDQAQRALSDASNAAESSRLQNQLAASQAQQQTENSYVSSRSDLQNQQNQLEEKKQALDGQMEAIQTEHQAVQDQLKQIKDQSSLSDQAQEYLVEQKDQNEQNEKAKEKVGFQEEEQEPSDDSNMHGSRNSTEEKSRLETRLNELQLQLEQKKAESSDLHEQIHQISLQIGALDEDYSRQLQQSQDNQQAQSQIDGLSQAAQSNAIENAKDARDKAAKELEEAKQLLDQLEVRAGQDGVVTEILVKEGDLVTEKQDVLQMGSASKEIVRTLVGQENITQIEPGMEVEMSFSSAPDQIVKGKVKNVKQIPEPDSDATAYEVEVQVLDHDLNLLNGMTCDARFILRQVKDVLTLSNKAIVLKDGRQTVQVRNENGELEERVITTGFSDGRISEVKSGLKEGETAVKEE